MWNRSTFCKGNLVHVWLHAVFVVVFYSTSRYRAGNAASDASTRGGSVCESFVNLHVFFGFLFVFLPLPDERDGICPYWYSIILCILCCSRIVFKTPCQMKPIRTNVDEPLRSLLHLLPVPSNLEWWIVKPSKTPKPCKAFQSAWSKVFKSWNYLHGLRVKSLSLPCHWPIKQTNCPCFKCQAEQNELLAQLEQT